MVSKYEEKLVTTENRVIAVDAWAAGSRSWLLPYLAFFSTIDGIEGILIKMIIL